MNILRAHKYAHVESVRSQINTLPPGFQLLVSKVPFIILPKGLSPLFIGLMEDAVITHDGRLFSECGGWFCNGEYRGWGDMQYIYLDSDSAWATHHELGHYIDYVLGYPSQELYRPRAAWYEYMASNPSEYFACAFDAYVTPERSEYNYGNKATLFDADLNIFEWFTCLEEKCLTH